jgi:IS4 transposase
VSDRRGVDDFRYPKDTIIVDDRGYFDCKLFKQRVDDGNLFVCRIKDNTLYEVVCERELPDDADQHVLLDEEIQLTGKSAIKTGMNKVRLRRVVVYIEKDNRTVELITNNMDWKASTIAELYKRRWDIEIFFKLIKQNLQIKTFIGTSENACKSQIWVAMICYLLIEIIRRVICKTKTKHSYSHCILIIRVCITRYTTLNYVMNQTQVKVRKARKHTKTPPNLFSNCPKKKNFEQLMINFKT